LISDNSNDDVTDKPAAAKKQRTTGAKSTPAQTAAHSLRDVFVGFVARYLEGREVVQCGSVSKAWHQAITEPASDSTLWQSICTARFGFTLTAKELAVYSTAFDDNRPWFHCYRH